MANETATTAVVKGKKKKEHRPQSTAWTPATPADSQSVVFDKSGTRTRTVWTLRAKIGEEKKVLDRPENYVPYTQTEYRDLDTALVILRKQYDAAALLSMIQSGVDASNRQTAATSEARIHGIARSFQKVKKSMPWAEAIKKAREAVA